MLTRLLLFGSLAASAALALTGSDDRPKAGGKLVVHEWGTFTTLSGSNGTQLVGLTHDEEALPKFVYRRDALEKGFDGVRVKMETPVIYVYSDREREISVDVGFPKGILTQWYPHVRNLAPAAGFDNGKLAGGVLGWGTVTALAPGQGLDKLPATSKDDPWNFARQTDANVLRQCTHGEFEKFLFYRGLGNFELPIKARVGADGRLRIENSGSQSLDGTVLLRVTKSGIFAKGVDGIKHGAVTTVDVDLPETTVKAAMETVAERLEKAGLYRKEAVAMVNTWRKSYFETPGFRILYMVPPGQTDAILPLTLNPKPDELVRVLVGRLDVLLPEDEERAKKTIREAGSMEQARTELGRFADPIVKHVRDTTDDAALRASAERLLDAH
jgi:hypothetical protein